ncbi:PGF-CTERM sorting domain-containing protein [Halobacterium noricense]|uniref:PGF-CTERM sorting domain-containing protein n=1 Tax=Halobacterium noricense TaxID=223182 RepID=UPI001E5F7FAA|nr:PGF-CTERM sorting domain-containing protein [Halobacterium noricense]UHH25504.1 PGF-CTERM sorting domain-containing protein [Halobacterium noricense]
MRRRDVLRASAATAALPLASTTVSSTTGQQSAFDPLGVLALDGTKEVVVGDAGETAYVATTDGIATVDISDPANPEQLAGVAPLLDDHENGPMRMVYDVKLEGDTLIAVGPANPTQTETVQGVVVFDVSDPANPRQTGFHETEFPIHNAYLQDGVAYLTENDGAKNPAVFVDVSGDTVEEVGRWSNVDYDERWQDVYAGMRACHDLYVHEDTLYIAYWDAGTWLVDVSDPANPEYVNHFGHYSVEDLQDIPAGEAGAESLSVPGNAHYVAVNEDASVLASGAEAWDVDTDDSDPGQGGIDLWDVSDPRNPEKLAFIAPPPTPDGTRQGTWTTSHNFEFHGDRLYTSWYQGGVKLHDVSDPANPEELAWWRQPEEARFWTAQYATDEAFVAGNMGGQTYAAGVYTFPNRAGEQPDPPTLETTTVPTSTATETTTATEAATPTATETTTTGESGSSVPGFGALAALAGVSGAALAAWRRNDDA